MNADWFKSYAFLPQMDPLYQFLQVLKYFFCVPKTCCRAHTLGLEEEEGGKWAMSEEEGMWGAEKVGSGELRRCTTVGDSGGGGGGREGCWFELQHRNVMEQIYFDNIDLGTFFVYTS